MILIQAPDGASTSKYPIFFPWPINLISTERVVFRSSHEDVKVVDLNLECRLMKKDDVLTHLEVRAREFVEEDIILNCGEFPCNGRLNPYFKKAIEVFKPTQLIGTYPTIEFGTPLPDFAMADYRLIDIFQYPLYQKKPKACMRLTQGCPNACLMCPVFVIYKRKYSWIDKSILFEWFSYFQKQGINLITLLDDNLSADIETFVAFFDEVYTAFPKLKFHVTEGFEVKSIVDERVCKIIKRQFKEPNIGIESVQPNVLKSINKCYTDRETIEKAVANLEKFNIKCRAFFLLGMGESQEDIIETIKFFIKHKMPVRTNIVRDYKHTKYEHREASYNTMIKDMKKLADAASFLAGKGIDIFGDISQLKRLGLHVIQSNIGFVVSGKVNYGQRGSQFCNAVRYMLESKYKKKFKLIFESETAIKFIYYGKLGVI